MFAIYIPGRHRNDSAILHEVGAGWALDPSVTAMFLDVDLGPDGGAGGGLIVATGTPSDVAASPESITGRYLAEYINRLKR